MMHIKFNFNNFIFYGACLPQLGSVRAAYAVVAGGCDWPLLPEVCPSNNDVIALYVPYVSCVTFLTSLRSLLCVGWKRRLSQFRPAKLADSNVTTDAPCLQLRNRPTMRKLAAYGSLSFHRLSNGRISIRRIPSPNSEKSIHSMTHCRCFLLLSPVLNSPIIISDLQA